MQSEEYGARLVTDVWPNGGCRDRVETLVGRMEETHAVDDTAAGSIFKFPLSRGLDNVNVKSTILTPHDLELPAQLQT